MRILLPLVTVWWLLAGCGGPCSELDGRCESCQHGSVVERCKYYVTWLSNQKCDQILETAGDTCPYRYLPGVDGSAESR